nr:retrovirus-related Pol polyprotein from transposon TNT 1-94 [Tanacetum cinerariifolium]
MCIITFCRHWCVTCSSQVEFRIPVSKLLVDIPTSGIKSQIRVLVEARSTCLEGCFLISSNEQEKKAYNTLILCLGYRVLREITKETTAAGIWKILETLLMTKSLANCLHLKKKLYTFHMHPGKSQSEYIDEFHKLISELAAIDTAISNGDQTFLLLTSLSSSYDNFVETLLYARDTLKLEDVLATLNYKELQKMMKAKGDGGKGLYVRRRSAQRDMEQGTYSAWSNHRKEAGYPYVDKGVYLIRNFFRTEDMEQGTCYYFNNEDK